MRDFDKKALSVEEQLELLVVRGLRVQDKTSALAVLKKIGYYRLSSYMRLFQQGDEHVFLSGTEFKDILDIYRFDESLRAICFEAISKIEIAYRSAICNTMCEKYDSHWFLNPSVYSKPDALSQAKSLIETEIKKRGNDYAETFISKYYEKYNTPEFPPFWMCAETFTIGSLNKLYQMIRLEDKVKIVEALGFQEDQKLMSTCNWLFVFCITRNICAHHSRLFNRIFRIEPTSRKKIAELNGKNNRFYRVLQVISYCHRSILIDSDFESKISALLASYPNINKQMLGFPKDWTHFTFTRTNHTKHLTPSR